MDLITFSSGIEGIQPGVDTSNQPQLPLSKNFVPLGQSIEQHTSNLFNADELNTEKLRALADPETNISLDAAVFSDLIKSTLSSIKQMSVINQEKLSPQESAIYQRAIAVIADLDGDRRLLLTQLQALNRA